MILEENLESRGYPGNDFELPDNWTVTELGKVLQSISSGFACGRNQQVSSGLVHLRPMNISPEGKIDLADCRFVPEDAGEQRLQAGDVLFNNTNSVVWVGKTASAEREHHGMAYSNHMTRLRFASVVESRFAARQIDWLRQNSYFALHCNKHVNQASISGDFLRNNVPMLVPPLAEQKRISDKLEAVLGRVDTCRGRLDRVPDLLKRFRQSVLAAATSGKLSENWRASNVARISWLDAVGKQAIPLPTGYRRLSKQPFKPTPIEHRSTDLPRTWSVHTVQELYEMKVLIDFADGNHGSLYPRKGEFGPDGALFLTASQIRENWRIDLNHCPRLNWKKAKQLVKGWARNDDVLLSHNATVGRVGLLKSEEDVLLGTSVTFYRFNTDFILPHFARIIFSSRFFQDQLESVMKQTTRNQVPITKQGSLSVLCPPLKEQQEIVRRVDALFALSDRIEGRLTEAGEKLERLTPVTLAKAFRGELVPQDPNDEPASALLERLLTAKKTEAAQPRPKKAPHVRIMKNLTRESITDAIRSMDKDTFSFSDLREKVEGDYEALTEAVFHLLADEKPILKQVFNTKVKSMQFQRSKG